MFQKFIQWLRSLFGAVQAEAKVVEQEFEHSFAGTIKDDVDQRDHVFTVKGD